MMRFFQKLSNTKGGDYFAAPPSQGSRGRGKRFCIIVAAVVLFVLALALGLGLGIGLKKKNDSSSDESGGGGSFQYPSGNTPTVGVNGTFWQPKAGDTWQIVLQQPIHSYTPNVSIFDIDLFENNETTVANIHNLGSRVICYFSAGSYEPYRPDSKDFLSSDYGKALKGWPDEKWLDTTSTNVRTIMTKRLQLAAAMGCDAVDPDNVDGFANDSGFPLTAAGALDYMRFLASVAHPLKLAIGLKNAGAIVNQTTDFLQFSVNEQCVEYNECESFRGFVDVGKPVFHIEYVDGSVESSGLVQSTVKSKDCGNVGAAGFSTLMKNLDLGDWVEAC